MNVLYEDNHLLAVCKPAGVPSQRDSSGDESLADLAAQYLKEKYHKPGNVYVGLVHRLDRPVSGVILLARTDKAASRLSESFRSRAVEKIYLAGVECHANPEKFSAETMLADYVLPGDSTRVLAADSPGCKKAQLALRMIQRFPGGSGKFGRAWMMISLITGVKHQIRAQLAHAGLPVIGDFRYGPFSSPARPDPVQNGRAVMLHSHRLTITHPVRKEEMSITAPPPEYFTPAPNL